MHHCFQASKCVEDFGVAVEQLLIRHGKKIVGKYALKWSQALDYSSLKNVLVMKNQMIPNIRLVPSLRMYLKY